MPTVLHEDGYRFFFYSMEGNEPPHIHVEAAEKVAKYWLEPVDLAMSDGFKSHELKKVRMLVIKHRIKFKEAWDAHFGT